MACLGFRANIYSIGHPDVPFNNEYLFFCCLGIESTVAGLTIKDVMEDFFQTFYNKYLFYGLPGIWALSCQPLTTILQKYLFYGLYCFRASCCRPHPQDVIEDFF